MKAEEEARNEEGNCDIGYIFTLVLTYQLSELRLLLPLMAAMVTYHSQMHSGESSREDTVDY
eukprot:2340625-Rhodomonas_salina.4